MITEVLISLAAGVIVGVLFFGNLRWSISKLQLSSSPLLIYGCSLLVRMGLVFAFILWALQYSTQALIAGTIGFMVARLFLVTTTAFRREPGRCSKGSC